MIKLICDKCGKDCDLIARDIQVCNIINPIPHDVTDIGLPTISNSNERKRFLLCQNCYKKMGLPNLYMDGLVFGE